MLSYNRQQIPGFLFVISIMVNRTTSAIIHPTIATPSPPNLLAPSGTNISTLEDIIPVDNSSQLQSMVTLPATCVLPYRWFNPLFQPKDCEGALLWFFLQEIGPQDLAYREFISWGEKKHWDKVPPVMTPRKYNFSEYTMK